MQIIQKFHIDRKWIKQLESFFMQIQFDLFLINFCCRTEELKHCKLIFLFAMEKRSESKWWSRAKMKSIKIVSFSVLRTYIHIQIAVDCFVRYFGYENMKMPCQELKFVVMLNCDDWRRTKEKWEKKSGTRTIVKLWYRKIEISKQSSVQCLFSINRRKKGWKLCRQNWYHDRICHVLVVFVLCLCRFFPSSCSLYFPAY